MPTSRLLCAAVGLTAMTCVAAQDALVVSPDAGAFPVGTAQNLSYASGSMRVTGSLATGLQVLEPTGASPGWRLSIRAPSGSTLAPGCFERGLRFATSARPGIDFSFGSSGCNATFGRFRILEIATDPGGNVTSLAADFAQQCERFGKAVFGKLRFNSTLATTGGFLEPVLSASGNLTFTAQAGAIGSTAPGGTGNIALTRQTTRPSVNFDNGISFSYDGTLPGGGTGFWSLDFAAPANVPLFVGNYPNATRYPFQAASAPGLDFSYNGSGCNTLAGDFNLTAVRYDGLDAVPLELTGTFNQRCPNAQGPLTSGTINYSAVVNGPTSLYGEGVLFRARFEEGDRPSLYFPSCQ